MNRSNWGPRGFLALWWLSMTAVVWASPETEVLRLRDENDRLKQRLSAVQAELAKLKSILKQQQTVHGVDPATSSSLANSLLRQMPISEFYDEQHDVTTVATEYVRFGGSGFLPVKRLLKLAYTYPGQEPVNPIDSVTLWLAIGQSGVLSGKVTTAQLDIDGSQVDVPVPHHHIDRKRRSVGRKRTVQEQHRVEISLSRQQIRLIANAKTVLLSISGQPFPLTQEQIYLFAGIDARLALHETQTLFSD